MPLTRRTATIALLAIVAAACARPPGLPEEPAEVPTETVVAGLSTAANTATADDAGSTTAQPTAAGAVSGSASGDVEAADAPSPESPDAPELPDTVEVVEPDYVIDAGAELDDETIARVTSLEGLEHVARVARLDLRLSGPQADLDARAMAVSPDDFRPLTPEVTAQAVGVWERLAAGDVVVRHDIAHELGIELGGNLLLAGEDSSRVARVGAFAANGTPPVAAVLVPWSIAQELGVNRPNGLVVAVSDAQVDGAAAAIGGLLEGADVQRRRPPQQQTSSTENSSGGSSRLQPFDYTDFGDGTIAIDPDWVSRHIRTVEIPGIATTRCHELMIPQLLAALQEIQAAGLYDHFKPEQFGGCWVPRHIDWDPSKPLSNHAWGIAIDFNTHDNWLGEQPQMDMRIVAIFEKWGFEWGGHWRRPDGMHFELDRIVRPSGG